MANAGSCSARSSRTPARRAKPELLLHPQLSCPAQAGHPVRRGLSADHAGFWNTGSPAFAGDDTVCSSEDRLFPHLPLLDDAVDQAPLQGFVRGHEVIAIERALDIF